ncbi:MAG: single-stranded-DNA-specific exonuclease RecJ [Acidobacteriota bacterium]
MVNENGWPGAQRKWLVRESDADTVANLEAELGLLPATAMVLAARGLCSAEAVKAFLHPTLDRLHSPFCFLQMEAAVDRLLRALKQGDRIVVHGDYDVDGITGTVVLVTVLRALGGDVTYLVPHRMRDGYGLHQRGIEAAHQAGARLVIAVDCGINAHAAAERARELGIELLIVDHHQPGPQMPPATAILNPRLEDAGYPEEDLAAVAVAFKLARGLLQRHPAGFRGTSLLKLVAIGTVADLVPLCGENRVIAHYGLATLLEAANPGLRALLDLSGIRAAPVSADDIAFRLAPRINAAGRLGDAGEAVELFLTTDPGRARRLAHQLESANSRRRRVTDEVAQAAMRQVPADADPIAVVAGEGWHRGVIGIVASRLVEEWGRPVVVISIEGEKAYGSARSLPGFSIVKAFDGVADLLEEYGGHHQAAGLQLAACKVDSLREGLKPVATESLAEATRRRSRFICDAELSADQPLAGLALELERLSPFGVGNRKPRFLYRDLEIKEEVTVLNEAHLRLRLAAAGGTVEAIAWRQGHLAARLHGQRRIDAVASLEMRRWGGRMRPQLELLAFRPT